MAKVILKLDYVQGGSQEFSGYINYIDRDAAKQSSSYEEQLFHGYLDYMDRDQALGTGLFSSSEDKLSNEKVESVKEILKEVQKKTTLCGDLPLLFRKVF